MKQIHNLSAREQLLVGIEKDRADLNFSRQIVYIMHAKSNI